MQTWPTKVGLPTGLFAALNSHEVAQQIAEKQYLPDDMDDLLTGVIRKTEQKKVNPVSKSILTLSITKRPPETQTRRERL